MSSTKLKVQTRIERLKKMMNNLNTHITRVNKIFSAAHLIAMQDLVANVLMMRQKSLALRSSDSYRDPAFDPIKTFSVPEISEDEVTSFLQVKSKLSSKLTTSEESLAGTQQLLDEMLSIVQNLDRVRKNTIGDEDQRREDIKEHGDRIKRDIAAWKQMKIQFEAERNVLAQIRDTIETLLATKKKNLELNEDATSKLFGSSESAQTSHANVMAALQQHNQLIGKVCVAQAEDDFNSAATGFQGDDMTDECVSCLSRQARGENIACDDLCVDGKNKEGPTSFTMDDDEISNSMTGSSMTGSDEDLDIDDKDGFEIIQEESPNCGSCLVRQKRGENIACEMCEDKSEKCTICLTRQAQGENIECAEICDGKSKVPSKDPCMKCIEQKAAGENVDCEVACDDDPPSKVDPLKEKVKSLDEEDEIEDDEVEEGVEEENELDATGFEEEEEQEEALEATGLAAIMDDLEKEEEEEEEEDHSPPAGCDGVSAFEANSCDECEFVFLKYVSYDSVTGERRRDDNTPGVCTACMLVDDGIRIDHPSKRNSNFNQLKNLGDAEWCKKKEEAFPTGGEEIDEEEDSEIDGGSSSKADVTSLEDLETHLDQESDDDIMDMLDHMSSLLETASRLRGSLKWE